MVCGWRVCRIVGEVEMLPWKGRRAQKQNTRAEVAPCIFRGHVVKNYNIIIYIYIYIYIYMQTICSCVRPSARACTPISYRNRRAQFLFETHNQDTAFDP